MKNNTILRIDLPGAKNIFFLEDLTDFHKIEKTLEQIFYPYACEVFIAEESTRPCIYIEADASSLKISRKMGNPSSVTLKVNSIFAACKKILSLLRDNLLIDDNYCYLHGSVVVFGENTCLFLAESGTGKSTLSVYCDLNNHLCLTDDLIILNTRNYKIYPISRYANIRDTGVFLFEKKLDSLRYNGITMRYEYLLSPHRFNSNYQISHIFVLHREHSQTSINISKKPFEDILHNAFLPYQLRNNIISSLKICGNYTIYEVTYNCLEDLIKKITDFTNENGGDQSPNQNGYN